MPQYRSAILGKCSVSCINQIDGTYKFRVSGEKYACWVTLKTKSFKLAVETAEQEYCDISRSK